MEIITIKVNVTGRVQGVGFRWFSREQAQDLEVNGTVKNLVNGEVEIVAQGKETEVWKFINILREGPAFANVLDLKIQELEIDTEYNSFDVLF